MTIFTGTVKDIYRVHRYFYDPNGAENLHLPNVAPIIAPLMEKEFSEITHIGRAYHTDIVFIFKQPETRRKESLFCRSGNTQNFHLSKDCLLIPVCLPGRSLSFSLMRLQKDTFIQRTQLAKPLNLRTKPGNRIILKLSGYLKNGNETVILILISWFHSARWSHLLVRMK